jgi:hypothetical protein
MDCSVDAPGGTSRGAMSGSLLANNVIGSNPVDVTFTCPTARDARETGGLYSMLFAPVSDDILGGPATCVRK